MFSLGLHHGRQAAFFRRMFVSPRTRDCTTHVRGGRFTARLFSMWYTDRYVFVFVLPALQLLGAGDSVGGTEHIDAGVHSVGRDAQGISRTPYSAGNFGAEVQATPATTPTTAPARAPRKASYARTALSCRRGLVRRRVQEADRGRRTLQGQQCGRWNRSQIFGAW